MSTQQPYGPQGYDAQPSRPYYPNDGPEQLLQRQPPAPIPADPYPQQAAPQVIPYPVPVVQPADPGSGLAITSLILGLLSMVAAIGFSLVPLCGLIFVTPLSVIGIIFGVLGRRSTTRRGMALAGLILSVLALVITLGLIVYLGFFAPDTSF